MQAMKGLFPLCEHPEGHLLSCNREIKKLQFFRKNRFRESESKDEEEYQKADGANV